VRARRGSAPKTRTGVMRGYAGVWLGVSNIERCIMCPQGANTKADRVSPVARGRKGGGGQGLRPTQVRCSVEAWRAGKGGKAGEGRRLAGVRAWRAGFTRVSAEGGGQRGDEERRAAPPQTCARWCQPGPGGARGGGSVGARARGGSQSCAELRPIVVCCFLIAAVGFFGDEVDRKGGLPAPECGGCSRFGIIAGGLAPRAPNPKSGRWVGQSKSGGGRFRRNAKKAKERKA
jgi:hypothetical protein